MLARRLKGGFARRFSRLIHRHRCELKVGEALSTGEPVTEAVIDISDMWKEQNAE